MSASGASSAAASIKAYWTGHAQAALWDEPALVLTQFVYPLSPGSDVRTCVPDRACMLTTPDGRHLGTIVPHAGGHPPAWDVTEPDGTLLYTLAQHAHTPEARLYHAHTHVASIRQEHTRAQSTYALYAASHSVASMHTSAGQRAFTWKDTHGTLWAAAQTVSSAYTYVARLTRWKQRTMTNLDPHLLVFESCEVTTLVLPRTPARDGTMRWHTGRAAVRQAIPVHAWTDEERAATLLTMLLHLGTRRYSPR